MEATRDLCPKLELASDESIFSKPILFILVIRSRLMPDAVVSFVDDLDGGCDRDLRGLRSRWNPLAIDALPTKSGIRTALKGNGLDGGEPSGDGAGVGVGEIAFLAGLRAEGTMACMPFSASSLANPCTLIDVPTGFC